MSEYLYILIFLLTLLLATTNMVPMSLAALIGALVMAWFGLDRGLFTYEEALSFIDFKLLGLLIGFMIFMEVTERSGIFRALALHAVNFAGNNPRRLFFTVCFTSAAMSMFLSDQPAILLIVATMAVVTRLTGLDPTPYFISATIMVNLGGTSTLMGSTSNIVIGTKSGLSFNDFITGLLPCEITLWILTALTLYYYYKPRLEVVHSEDKSITHYDPWTAVEDRKQFYLSIVLLVLLFALLISAEHLGVGPEAIAIGFAILALALSKSDTSEIFGHLDWDTIFFLAGFFFIVEGLKKTGFLASLSPQILAISGGNIVSLTLLTLWFSGIGSMVLSNTVVALSFIPILEGINLSNSVHPWMALILGTNLGGAATPISGAVVIMAMGALKQEGVTVSFNEFSKPGILTSLVQLAFSTAYLILRFGWRW